ncbi:MAG: Protease Do [Microgenomates group bacterium GW2011_GWF2_47_9]|nr:MAG: Protease Do [Microgenomates group bacterium GW2011_GWF2_47_9]
MQGKVIKQFLLGVLVGVFTMLVFFAGVMSERLWALPILENLLPKSRQNAQEMVSQKILTEESVVTEVASRVSTSVVTVSVLEERRVSSPFSLDPFGFFESPDSDKVETREMDIGSGFIVDSGLVVTNKHVVSGSADKYKVILKNGEEYQVEKIWRDPQNDLAILKVSGGEFVPIELGDSDNLRVGNFVIAIGTALGEFRHTVTTGVVSGLGRGITAGDGYSGFAEELDNVIQTDAAINPGNSGGPLLNSLGQAIGVNVAVSQGANNIGFALPINIVKASLQTFNETGQFDRAFFGVRYQLISQSAAILNDLPAGALVREVVENSSADISGIKPGDIITVFEGQKVTEELSLAELVLGKKIGDKVEVEIYRDGQKQKLTVTMQGEPS